MREQFDSLIVSLIAIQEFSKDIHYTCHGDSFFSKHLLVDKFNFYEAIDLIKETCLLGNGDRPLASIEYLKNAAGRLIAPKENDDKANFEFLCDLVYNTLEQIDSIEGLNKADENVIGGIAQKLQQYKGLINLQVV